LQCSTWSGAVRKHCHRCTHGSTDTADTAYRCVADSPYDIDDIADTINDVAYSFYDSAGDAAADAERRSLHAAARNDTERGAGARQRKPQCSESGNDTAVICVSADNGSGYGQSDVCADDAAG